LRRPRSCRRGGGGKPEKKKNSFSKKKKRKNTSSLRKKKSKENNDPKSGLGSRSSRWGPSMVPKVKRKGEERHYSISQNFASGKRSVHESFVAQKAGKKQECRDEASPAKE